MSFFVWDAYESDISVKLSCDFVYKRLPTIIPAYACDNVSADKIFKETIYLYGQALSKVVRLDATLNGMKKMNRRDVSQMGKITKILKADDIGDMGIGAMIVFIAMVLVAGIAASVLIQTANRLEIQAMTTGQETTGEVSTGLHISKIAGNKSVAGTTIKNIEITVQPRAGSKDIDLSKTYIEISDTTKKCVLIYTRTEYHPKTDVMGSLYKSAFFDTLSATKFGVVVLEDADGSCQNATPVVNRGDKVSLLISSTACFTTGIDPRDDIFGLVQPEEGAPGFFSFRAPSSIAGQSIFELY
jgi:archaeal flagellin FlaB